MQGRGEFLRVIKRVTKNTRLYPRNMSCEEVWRKKRGDGDVRGYTDIKAFDVRVLAC